MRSLPILGVILVTTAPLVAQNATSQRARTVLADVVALSADSLQGRITCQPGHEAAARYAISRLQAAGARPAGDSGTYRQHWTVGTTGATTQAGVAGCSTFNVMATIPGRGSLAGQYVIVGAHLDHLGTGRFGSMAADSGQIHNGADDNASGSAAVIELARLTARDRSRRDARPRRTVVFGLWSAEEIGSLGSAWYVRNLPMPKDSVIAYLNFDMVGRLREGRLMALGERSAEEWSELLDSANAEPRLFLRASGDGWGPSDHASFYAGRMPVLHFFTDVHEDYHRPGDDADKINADGIVQVADFAAGLIRLLDGRPRLTFVDVAPPPPPVAASGRGRPSLGTIPDMAEEPGGVRLSGVRAGSPADSAGMRAGDILVGIGQSTIANLQDFQDALMTHSAGDRVEIRYRRGDQLIRVMVTLGGRPAN